MLRTQGKTRAAKIKADSLIESGRLGEGWHHVKNRQKANSLRVPRQRQVFAPKAPFAAG